MRTVLVTGGCGYLGRHVVKLLTEEGFNVVALDNGKPKDDMQADIVDITDLESLQRVITKHNPDTVIHLAAVSEVVCVDNTKFAFDVNCFGTQNVLEACKNVRRVIFMSTFHVYGRSGTITEDTIPIPTHPYGITKLVGELFSRKAGNVAILRSANGVGVPLTEDTDRWKLVVPNLCREAQEKHSITLNSPGHQLRDFLPFKDIIQAMKILIDVKLDKDPVYNVGSGNPVSIRKIAEMVQEEYETLYGEKLEITAPEGTEEEGNLDFQFNKLKELGFKPTKDIRDEIRKTLQFCERFK